MDSAGRSKGCPIRKFPDQCVLPAPRDLSQVTTSFIASVCQGIHREPFVAWPIYLHNAWRSWIRILSHSPDLNLKPSSLLDGSSLKMVWITNQTLDASMTSKERYRVSALDSRIEHHSQLPLKKKKSRTMHPWDALFFPDSPMQLSRFHWTSLWFLRITVSPASFQPLLSQRISPLIKTWNERRLGSAS